MRTDSLDAYYDYQSLVDEIYSSALSMGVLKDKHKTVSKKFPAYDNNQNATNIEVLVTTGENVPYYNRGTIWLDMLPGSVHYRTFRVSVVDKPAAENWFPLVSVHEIIDERMRLTTADYIGDNGGGGGGGTPGAPGAPGALWYTGSGAPAGGLGIVKDMYLDSSSGDYYKKTLASTWALQGNLMGPAGTAGTNGTNGAAGSRWYTGAGAPANGLGVVNDMYLNTTNGDSYLKTGASVWTLQVSLKGPAGTAGTNGTNGTNGAPGTDGANGTNGANGATWLTGAGVPAGGLGAINDLYLNTANEDYYKKTGASVWTLQGTLKGTQGIQGIQGTPGTNGTNGAPGTDGTNGTNGAPGSVWHSGAGVPGNGLGVVNDFYIDTSNGDYYKKTGASVWTFQANLTGPAGGGGGGGGSAIAYNPVSRYQMVTTAGQAVSCVTSSTVFTGLSWTRAGTVLTMNRAGHSHSVGDRVIVRNTNVPHQVALVASANTDDYTIVCANTGPASGSAGAYSLGLTFAYNGAAGSISTGTISAPVGGDVQIQSIRIHLAGNTRLGNTFILVAPKGTLNGVSGETGNDDVYVPIQMVRQDGTTLVAVGNTIATSIAGDYGTFQFAALPAPATGIHILASF